MSGANVYSVGGPGRKRQKLKHSHECQLWAFSCWCMTRSREGGRMEICNPRKDIAAHRRHYFAETAQTQAGKW